MDNACLGNLKDGFDRECGMPYDTALQESCGGLTKQLREPCRAIGSQASVPMVHIPLESILNRWYGVSEERLSTMFKAADNIPGCIVFLDEIDSLASKRCPFSCCHFGRIRESWPYHLCCRMRAGHSSVQPLALKYYWGSCGKTCG